MWQLSQTFAQLAAGSLTARLDVSRPDEGLFDLRPNGRLWDGARLCGVTRLDMSEREALVEAYVRGNDLVATYAANHASQVRPEIYYRALSFPTDVNSCGFELIISAQTNLLGVNPTLRVTSRIPSCDARVLRPGDRWECVSLTAVPTVVEHGPAVFLFRPADMDWSYIEMIFPSDFTRAELAAEKTSPPALRLTSMLFPDQLEKGVIRRARLRGLFLPRSSDAAAALAGYREFADSVPPLTT